MRLIQRLIRPYVWHELPGWGRLYGAFVGDFRRDVEWRDEPRRTIRGKLHGYQLDLDLSRWSERMTYYLGRFYDLELQLLVLGLLRPGDRFVDIGANIGMITLAAASKVGETGVVDAFEPNPRCAARIRSFLEHNHIGHVRLHEMGVGDVDAELCLSVPRHNSGEGSFLPFDSTENTPDRYEQMTVPVHVADSILEADPRPPMMIKMDVEGFECFALKGLSRTIERHRPIVATEVESSHLVRAGQTPADLCRVMEDFGYEGWVFGLRRVGLRQELDLQPIDPAASSYNALWLPADGPARRRFEESFPNLARRPSPVAATTA
ncbi:MAG: FkbM family methyltransferase [Paludisphaera borealis]|uniref:FkbM family methyltransferase n=1 Tax=Paludisphaera borealis TaxID=1387353 RepID=UPI002846EEEF|nr:FkbM family methyltransferase [Paludisphaera borealis]MDR3621892.1 FkbM family methyltransferase [Paludisphaera borealis]